MGLLLIGLGSCNPSEKTNATQASDNPKQHHAHGEKESLEETVLHWSTQKAAAVGLTFGELPTRAITGYVQTNGWLEVDPQDKATVTPLIGANVTAIKVIEGDKVEAGQVLGYLSHPDLIKLQTNYAKTYYELAYLEKEYQRKKTLFEGEVASGRAFQQTKAQYFGTKGMLEGLGAQLKMMGLNLHRIRSGNIYTQVPIVSPIEGYIEEVHIKIGEYASQGNPLFDIINTAHVHADLMVFEKDARKIKVGQKVIVNVGTAPDTPLEATIYAVGKTFEKNPKAVHVHADMVTHSEQQLLPGMYITGKILTSKTKVPALPQEAVITEEGQNYIFTAEKVTKNGKQQWAFYPHKVVTGQKSEGWVEIKLPKPLPKDHQVVWNKAYYLIADIKKSETSHSH